MKYLCLLFFVAGSNSLFAAGSINPLFFGNYKNIVADTDIVSRKQKANDTDTVIRKQSVSVGVNYGSDALFFGRTGITKYPFVTGDIIYNSKPGFFAYGSVLKVLGYSPIDEIDVGGGYFYKLSKQFAGTVSYTRFFFNKEANVIKSASSNDINLKNSYDWHIVKSSIIMDYLFGKSNDFFVTVTQSKYIETSWGIFDDKDYLSFNPSFNFIVGTQNFVQRYALDHRFQQEVDNIYAHDDPNLARYNRTFRMLNYSFKIPVAYNRPHYTFEASWRYSIPVNVERVLENRKESFFNLTFYYLFY